MEKGNQVVTLNLSGIVNPINDMAITLSDSSDQSVENAIREIHEKYGKIGGFIHIHPHLEFQRLKFHSTFSGRKRNCKNIVFYC